MIAGAREGGVTNAVEEETGGAGINAAEEEAFAGKKAEDADVATKIAGLPVRKWSHPKEFH